MDKTLPNQIKSIRERNNLSQDRFGKKIGISGKAVSAYETGRATPSLKVLESISNTYKASFTSLTKNDKDRLSEKIARLEETLTELKSIFFEYIKA